LSVSSSFILMISSHVVPVIPFCILMV
jgi:hypothetical protein